MKKISSFVLCFTLAYTAHAQIAFQKTYGGELDDYGNSVRQSTDGGYIIVGSTESYGAGGSDVYLIKTDNTGDTLWTRTIGGADYEGGSSVQQTSDGGYIITGYAPDTSFGSVVYLIKTNGNGSVLWEKGFESGDGFSVYETNDHGYIICGTANGSYLSLIRTDSSGTALWVKYMTVGWNDEGYSVQQTNDGGFIVAGTYWYSGGYYAHLVKTNASGNILWSKLFNSGATNYICYSLDQTSDGGFIMSGYSNGDALLIKTNGNGIVLWTKTYDFPGMQVVGYGVEQAGDNGFIISCSNSAATTRNPILLKTDSVGNFSWAKEYLGNVDASTVILPQVEQTTDGGYILICSTDSFGAGGTDVYLIKTDGNGMSGCNENNLSATTIIQITSNSNFSLSVTTGVAVNIPPAIVGSGADVTSLCIVTGIIETSNQEYTFSNFIFPNPFSGSTVISFSLSQTQKVSLNIFDVSGRLVANLADKMFEEGENEISWNAADVNAGIYFLQMETEAGIENRKLIVAR